MIRSGSLLSVDGLHPRQASHISLIRTIYLPITAKRSVSDRMRVWQISPCLLLLKTAVRILLANSRLRSITLRTIRSFASISSEMTHSSNLSRSTNKRPVPTRSLLCNSTNLSQGITPLSSVLSINTDTQGAPVHQSHSKSEPAVRRLLSRVRSKRVPSREYILISILTSASRSLRVQMRLRGSIYSSTINF